MGPGMMSLPLTMQTSGWLPTLVMLVFVCITTTQASIYMSRAIQSFRNNRKFEVRLEFGSLALHLYPKWLYNVAIIALVFVFFCNNLANIVITSQTMDDLFLHASGKACAWPLGKPSTWLCVDNSSSSNVTDSLFGDQVVVSLGFLVTLIFSIPLGYINLEDNIGIQVFGMMLTLLCVAIWAAQFIALGIQPSLMPALGTGGSAFTYVSALPTVLFNYGFVATIPSWLNEKKPSVDVSSTIWTAQALATGQYLIFAILAALSINFSAGTDALSMINSGGVEGMWEVSKIMTFIFPIANVYTSIPVFSIIVRYNLLQLDGIKVPVWAANLLAVVLPWVVAVPFFAGNGLSDIINWSSALAFCGLNMILPVLFYVLAQRMIRSGKEPVVLEEGYENTVDEEDAAPSADVEGGVVALEQRQSLLTQEDGFAVPSKEGQGALVNDVPYPMRGLPLVVQLPGAYAIFALGVLCGMVALSVQIAQTAFPNV
jgi:amino acid permease